MSTTGSTQQTRGRRPHHRAPTRRLSQCLAEAGTSFLDRNGRAEERRGSVEEGSAGKCDDGRHDIERDGYELGVTDNNCFY